MSKPVLAIFDADSLIFTAGWAYRDQLNLAGSLAATKRVDKMINSILKRVNADYYIGFFGSDSSIKSFRHNVAIRKPYKDNRSKKEEWQEYFKKVIRKHFEVKWKFHPLDHLEADDAVVIAHHQFCGEYKIIHISEDKDMLQLGDFTRFNPSTKKLETFKAEDGRKFFHAQWLHGDTTDSIIGVDGIGCGDKRHKDVTPEMAKRGEISRNKIVQNLWALESPTEEDLFKFVRDTYYAHYKDMGLLYCLETYILIKMMHKPSMDYPDKPRIIRCKKETKYIIKELLDI